MTKGFGLIVLAIFLVFATDVLNSSPDTQVQMVTPLNSNDINLTAAIADTIDTSETESSSSSLYDLFDFGATIIRGAKWLATFFSQITFNFDDFLINTYLFDETIAAMCRNVLMLCYFIEILQFITNRAVRVN